MKLRFLCATHRLELYNKPEQLIYYWQNGFDTGQTLQSQGLFQDSIAHLGCAFETAEIILTTKALNSQVACELFMNSAKLLGQSFIQLQHWDQGYGVYRSAIDRLKREFSQFKENQIDICRYLGELHEELESSLQKASPRSQPKALKVIH